MKYYNSFFFIFIFILTFLIPFSFNHPLNETETHNKKTIINHKEDPLHQNEEEKEYKQKKEEELIREGIEKKNDIKRDEKYDRERRDEFDDDDDREERYDDRGGPNITAIMTLIEEYEKKKQDLILDIQKGKIIIIFLSILAGILFIIIIIYGSIKCFMLCSKKNYDDYRLSKISINKLGEVYIDESIQDKENKNFVKNVNNYGAPVNANNNNSDNNSRKKKIETFNPDNYNFSNEDKRLYKPYKSEEIQ
jgi:hypothetical protein